MRLEHHETLFEESNRIWNNEIRATGMMNLSHSPLELWSGQSEVRDVKQGKEQWSEENNELGSKKGRRKQRR